MRKLLPFTGALALVLLWSAASFAQTVRVPDGNDVAEGATTDAAATAGGTGTLSAKLRNATSLLNSILTAVLAAPPLGTTGGWTPLIANALSTTVKAIKGTAGQLGMLQCYNPNATVAYVQVFNVVSGSVTLGTTAPTLSIPIAPTSTGGYALAIVGIQFSTAMSAAATTTATGSSALGTALDCNVAFN